MTKGDIRLKTPDDIKRIRECGRIISEIFKNVSEMVLTGISTLEVDQYIDNYIHKKKARAAFKTVRGYDYASCISINNEVVHGIPSKKKIIKNGDLIKVDIGIVLNGYFSDACCTFPVSKITESAENLINTCKKSLDLAVEKIQPGRRLSNIGKIIQEYAEKQGFTVVRNYTGHGVGFALHEPPIVPHIGKNSSEIVMEEGLVIAVEPILNEGSHEVKTLDDGWTTVTVDGKLSAQFEHTVAVTANGPVVLTG